MCPQNFRTFTDLNLRRYAAYKLSQSNEFIKTPEIDYYLNMLQKIEEENIGEDGYLVKLALALTNDSVNANLDPSQTSESIDIDSIITVLLMAS